MIEQGMEKEIINKKKKVLEFRHVSAYYKERSARKKGVGRRFIFLV